MNQAIACEKAQDFKGAVHFWDEYFEAAPDPNPLHYVSYAKDLERLGEITLAARMWTKHLKKTALPKMSHCQRAAYTCMKTKDFETAAKHWERLCELRDQTNEPIDVSWLPCIAITYFELENYQIAEEKWKEYLSILYKHKMNPPGVYLEYVIDMYLKQGKDNDAKAIFEYYKKSGCLTPGCYHAAAITYYFLNEDKEACSAWDMYSASETNISARSCRFAAILFIREGRFDRAVEFYKKIPTSDRIASDTKSIKQLSHLLKTNAFKRKSGPKASKTPVARKRGEPNSEILHRIQLDVVSSIVEQARGIIDKVKETEDETLMMLRARMLEHYGTCLALEAGVKSTPYVISSPSVSATHLSSSSGMSSSSSAPQAANPLKRVQDLLRKIEALHKDWSRRHTLFQTARLKEASKAHFLAFAENPGSIFTLPESMNVRYLFGHEKTKPAAPVPLMSSSSSSSSSSSVSSSSSSVSIAPTVIWRFATRHVTKQRDSLKKMPAYIKDKIDLFVSEIEADPLQQRLRSGRLKSLVGAPNTFSRRVDQAHRFVYQLEEATPGQFNVTILSFLNHYKNLDFSKQS